MRNYRIKHKMFKQKYIDIFIFLERINIFNFTMRNVSFFLTARLPSCSSDFDDLAPTPTPPERRQSPVGTTCTSRPAFLGEQKDL